MQEDEMICRRMLKALNLQFKTNFSMAQFLEWSSDYIEPTVGEKIYKLKGEYNGIYVAIKI